VGARPGSKKAIVGESGAPGATSRHPGARGAQRARVAVGPDGPVPCPTDPPDGMPGVDGGRGRPAPRLRPWSAGAPAQGPSQPERTAGCRIRCLTMASS
jgi:hypothetical protein